ncbi:MAG: hypothetical protein ACYCWW_10580 [Deltaproteobacteria bacterium]
MLMVLMIILALMILGQMVMLLMNNVAKASGSFRRAQRGDYCAEEGLALGRAWVAQNAPSGSLSASMLSGTVPVAAGSTVPGQGLLADPTDPTDLANKDLCSIGVAVTIAGIPSPVTGLGGLCRVDANNKPLYRVNLVDDIDESTGGKTNPWVDANGTILIRSECLSTDAWHCGADPTGKHPAHKVVSMEYIQMPQT